MLAVHPVLLLDMANDRLNGRMPSQLAFDRRCYVPFLTGDESRLKVVYYVDGPRGQGLFGVLTKSDQVRLYVRGLSGILCLRS